jgi:hypothetical protein
VAWSISTSESPRDTGTVVCRSDEATPCILERSTPERVRHTGFSLQVLGPSPTKFTGSFTIGFLEDPDPRRYKSEVELVSSGKEIRQSVFSRVTTVPGEYTVRIHLEETRPDLPQPRVHDLTVPVAVQ